LEHFLERTFQDITSLSFKKKPSVKAHHGNKPLFLAFPHKPSFYHPKAYKPKLFFAEKYFNHINRILMNLIQKQFFCMTSLSKKI
jgi:hypothetical protein